MRVGLYIRSIATARGAERVSVNIARGLAERGHEVDFLLEDLRGQLPRELDSHSGIRVVDLRANGGSRILQWGLHLRSALAALPRPARGLLRLLSHDDPPTLALQRYVRDARPNALMSFLNYPNAALLLAAPFCRGQTQIVVNVRNHISTAARHAESRWNANIPALMRALFPRADLILTPSQGVAEDVRAITGLGEERLHVVPNPVFREELLKLAEQPASHRWLDDADIPLILGIGKLKPQKDFATLLRAFALVRSQRPSRLLILGEGHEHDALLRLAQELGISDSVELAGFVENPYPYLRRASLFVLSSAWEGLPNALIEALACGCPVVSTDCPSGPEEILQGGKIGALVPVGEPEVMARAILQSLGTPPAREALVERARVYSLEASVSGYERLLAGK